MVRLSENTARFCLKEKTDFHNFDCTYSVMMTNLAIALLDNV